jgi:hypothetical protein
MLLVVVAWLRHSLAFWCVLLGVSIKDNLWVHGLNSCSREGLSDKLFLHSRHLGVLE